MFMRKSTIIFWVTTARVPQSEGNAFYMIRAVTFEDGQN